MTGRIGPRRPSRLVRWPPHREAPGGHPCPGGCTALALALALQHGAHLSAYLQRSQGESVPAGGRGGRRLLYSRNPTGALASMTFPSLMTVWGSWRRNLSFPSGATPAPPPPPGSCMGERVASAARGQHSPVLSSLALPSAMSLKEKTLPWCLPCPCPAAAVGSGGMPRE